METDAGPTGLVERRGKRVGGGWGFCSAAEPFIRWKVTGWSGCGMPVGLRVGVGLETLGGL